MQQPTPSSQRATGDDGVIALFISIGVVALLMIGAVVVDGGRAYFQRRAMQNAVDAAAMAGTRQIDRIRWSGSADSTLDTVVRQQVTDHHGTLDACHLLDYNGGYLQPKSGRCGAPEVAFARVSYGAQAIGGVEVRARSTETTFLAQVGNAKSVSVSVTASAAALIQIFQGGVGSPFVMCGRPDLAANYNPHDPAIYDMTKSSPFAYPILLSDNSVDVNGIRQAGFDTGHTPTSAQTYIPLQASQQRTCGAGSAMKGKVDRDEIVVGRSCTTTTTMCDVIGVGNGNGYDGTISNVVLNAKPCPSSLSSLTDCDLVLPVIDVASGNGSHITGRVVGWASAHVYDTGGNPKYVATINISPSATFVSGGYSAEGPVRSEGQIRSIKLIS